MLTSRVRPYSCFLQVNRKQEKDTGTETMRQKQDKDSLSRRRRRNQDNKATNLVKLSGG